MLANHNRIESLVLICVMSIFYSNDRIFGADIRLCKLLILVY